MGNTIFGKKNALLFGIALILLICGYAFLGQGPVDNPLSVTVAPLILVGVYCIFIPYAILAKGKGELQKEKVKNTGV